MMEHSENCITRWSVAAQCDCRIVVPESYDAEVKILRQSEAAAVQRMNDAEDAMARMMTEREDRMQYGYDMSGKELMFFIFLAGMIAGVALTIVLS